ncbi:unnamed protein product [Arabidopsis halleri]
MREVLMVSFESFDSLDTSWVWFMQCIRKLLSFCRLWMIIVFLCNLILVFYLVICNLSELLIINITFQ